MKIPAWICVLFLARSSFVQADKFDDAIRNYMDGEYILGASVAFYDGVSTGSHSADINVVSSYLTYCHAQF